MTNPLKDRYLWRLAWTGALGAVLACGGKRPVQGPAPVAPLPTAGLAGQQVSVLPLTLVAAEEELHWDASLADRRAALTRADSVIEALLRARAPEVNWLFPDELRRVARRAPGVATNPDQMGTALLRAENLSVIPDPLRSELRTLVALAGGGGGRYALVPAALVYRRSGAIEKASGDSGAQHAAPPHSATAELSIAMVDVRLGRIDWRTVARGDGDDPWSSLGRAMKSVTPGLP
ncbi:MAG TPA: hypothetical protein VIW28_07990 [Gemmatimonadales bacterium]